MSTPNLSHLPPDLQKIIDTYVVAKVAELAQQQQIANAPKVLSPHESLVDHTHRAEVAISGDTGAVAAYKFQFHVLEALQLLIKEVEGLSSSSSPVATSAPVDTTSPTVATTSVVTEGAL